LTLSKPPAIFACAATAASVALCSFVAIVFKRSTALATTVLLLRGSVLTPLHRLRMAGDSSFMEDLAEEAARRAEMAAAPAPPPPAAAPEDSAPLQDLLAVDVDLSLSLNEADASVIDAEADAIFGRVDADGDGTITMGELREHLAGAGVLPESLDSMFAALDANHDGVITPRELRAGFKRYESSTLRLALGLAGRNVETEPGAPTTRLLTPNRQALCDELFDSIDTNGDGVISPEELSEHLVSTRGYSSETVSRIFRALDVAPRDGKLSREEMRRSFEWYELSVLRLALGIQ